MASKEEIRALIDNAKIKILVQPQALFVIRESLIAPIVGETSTPRYSTLPVVHIEGWEDSVKLIVSCVTHDPPYKCHPFILVDQNRCRYGVYTEYLSKGNSKFAVLGGIGIKILTEEDFARSLEVRRYLASSPFENQRGTLEPVSPIIVRGYLTPEETSSSSVATSSSSAIQRETQEESLEQERLFLAAADDSIVDISNRSHVFTEISSIDRRQENLLFCYHNKGNDLSDSDSD